MAQTTIHNPEALVRELSDLLATENRGLVRHFAHAHPYITAKTYPLLKLLRQLSDQSVEHARRVTELMLDLELEPRASAFQPVVANYHYVSVDSLLPHLIDEKRSQIQAYQRAITHLGDHPTATAGFEALLNENRQQLAKLESAI